MIRDGLFPPMWTVVPESKSGNAVVEHFEVSDHASRMTAFGGGRSFVSAGKYARLRIDGQTVMSDTDYERRSNSSVATMARGRVFMAGLGLGMTLVPILKNRDVERVLVVEKSAGVIVCVQKAIERYVGPRAAKKLTVLLDDVWRDECREVVAVRAPFDCLWFDVWADTSTDHIEEMNALARKYRSLRRSTESFVDCWNRSYLRDVRREERRNAW